ncbi:fungal-specific transcription factor domain-containing protein [Bombardia bombarda]|uniref:Fungal-specific transcription factor domain-containing protein n=1 Tax=Bombardia bombarda TaxID=252184 RepID=A0AA39TMP4_9PEZI|nr:fungal-specific transcription factor domain-containing protein [Bombardia bombarda]
MSSSSDTPPDTIMVSDSGTDKRSNERAAADAAAGGNLSVPKPKRLACMICRKRKLKCDGTKPSCSTCTRLGHTCAYDEVRRKSGPKRGYVKALEERLKQVETLLKTQDVPTTSPDGSKTMPITIDDRPPPKPPTPHAPPVAVNFSVPDPSIAVAKSRDVDRWNFASESPNVMDDFNFNSNITMGMGDVENNFTWEMIGLGLEEPLPPQDTIDELHQIYFEKIHPSVPMIHKYRYLAAMNLAPNQRPPVCLRYAMWTLACSITEKFQDLKDLFYQRARRYVELDYIKGYGEHIISVAQAQAHILLASYEFKMMHFPRAWMSTGSAVRLCQMIGLHRLDGAGLDVKQCLPPPRDWTEREERRRTFWMAFCQDRYASIGTGWPMTVDEKDILTNLPSTDEAFEMSRPEQTQPLQDAMSPAGAGKMSAFGGIVLMACLFGRNLVHLHRPDVDDRDHDLNGEFWRRHRSMDNILLNTSLCLPSHLKLPNGLGNPNIVFTNMCIHTSTICLHQAAIFKADKNRLPASVSSESKIRCITAANEIASIMRMTSHLDLAAMNPFISFCLYVAARVFVQYLKSRPDDSQTGDSLRFLLSAMNALKRRNPLTESFLVQLDVDLEALGTRIPKLKSAFPRSSDSPTQSQMPAGMASKVRAGGEPGGQERGILSNYRNDCQFNQGNHTPNNNDANPNPDPVVEACSSVPQTSDPIQNWSEAPEPPASHTNHIPSRRSGPSYAPVHGLMPNNNGSVSGIFGNVNDVDGTGSGNDLSSPDATTGQSNRPTPNSSTTVSSSDQHSQHQRQQNGGGPVPGPGGGGLAGLGGSLAPPGSRLPGSVGSGSGTRVPFEASSGISGGGGSGHNESFYADPASFGLTPDRFGMPDTPGGSNDFGAGSGWPDMSSTAGDGVLRSLMSMGPMETMDLGWEVGP